MLIVHIHGRLLRRRATAGWGRDRPRPSRRRSRTSREPTCALGDAGFRDRPRGWGAYRAGGRGATCPASGVGSPASGGVAPRAAASNGPADSGEGPKPTVALRFVRIDRQGRVHGEGGRFSAVLWSALDSGGRRITLTRAALRHARGEDEQGREVRAYLTETFIREAVARGGRYADAMPRRERVVVGGVGPSAHLVVVVEMHSDAGTVVTAYAMRRMPDVWMQL